MASSVVRLKEKWICHCACLDITNLSVVVFDGFSRCELHSASDSEQIRNMKSNTTRFAVVEKRPGPRFEGEAGGALDTKLLLTALTALKKGDFTVRLPLVWTGIAGKIPAASTDVTGPNEKVPRKLERTSGGAGKEGGISQRAPMGEASGAWANSITW